MCACVFPSAGSDQSASGSSLTYMNREDETRIKCWLIIAVINRSVNTQRPARLSNLTSKWACGRRANTQCEWAMFVFVTSCKMIPSHLSRITKQERLSEHTWQQESIKLYSYSSPDTRRRQKIKHVNREQFHKVRERKKNNNKHRNRIQIRHTKTFICSRWLSSVIPHCLSSHAADFKMSGVFQDVFLYICWFLRFEMKLKHLARGSTPRCRTWILSSLPSECPPAGGAVSLKLQGSHIPGQAAVLPA